VARSVCFPGVKGGLSGVTARWLEVPPSCKSHCLCSLMLGCVYLHACYLIVLKLVLRGGIVVPVSTRTRQVGLRAASVCCMNLASLIAQLVKYLVVALTLHMVPARIVKASDLVVNVFSAGCKYQCPFVCSFTCIRLHILFALSQCCVILCKLLDDIESRLY